MDNKYYTIDDPKSEADVAKIKKAKTNIKVKDGKHVEKQTLVISPLNGNLNPSTVKIIQDEFSKRGINVIILALPCNLAVVNGNV